MAQVEDDFDEEEEEEEKANIKRKESNIEGAEGIKM